MRLKTLINKFLAWCDNTRKPATTKSYRLQLGKFLQRVGNLDIGKLKPVHLSTHGKTWHEVQAVQRLFQWAMDDLEIVRRNVFSKVHRPPAGQRTRILSPRELARWFWRARPRFRAFMIAMRETMARPQEIRAVTWEMLRCDPDWHDTLESALIAGRAMFVLRDYKARDRRLDPSAPRMLLINRRLGRMLARLRRGTPAPTGEVFRNDADKPWSGNAVRCRMRRLRRRCKVGADLGNENVVAYTIRHSILTLASSINVRDRILADLAGHTSTLTTARYQHLQVEHLRPAVAALEQIRIDARIVRLEEARRRKAA